MEKASATATPDSTQVSGPQEKLFVAGIGASAGGLGALGELLGHVPTRGMAFVVVQHLAPDHESVLPELLARVCSVKVVVAADGMPLESGTVYVSPPNADLAVKGGAIRLTSPAGRYGPHLPIDGMLRSLAEDQEHRAVGIVLSGMGTDGTLGLRAIKAAGGFTFVQDPSTAQYDGMPRSALAGGVVDVCLPPERIGDELARIVAHRAPRPGPRPPAGRPAAADPLSKLFALIRSEFHNDLADYKSSTIDRRVERRMALRRIENLAEYVRYVQANRAELDALYRDVLITVTSFFRDVAPFQALKSSVFPRLLERKDPREPIRVWVPACATGEEAYSIAICLVELLEEKGREETIKIFASDVEEDCIERARRGVYPPNIAMDVSADRMARFFVASGDDCQIAPRIRDMVVFAKQNVLRDAPFSHVDLVSCRNLLIYLQPAAQRRVLRTLHHALDPGGFLLLGASEGVIGLGELFSEVDRENRIYAKVETGALVEPSAPALAGQRGPSGPAVGRPAISLGGLADRKVMELYGPPGVVINAEREVLRFLGQTGRYLEPPPGAASLNLLRMVRFDLHVDLKKAIDQAIAEQKRVTTQVRYMEGDKRSVVELDVVPLEDPDTKASCLLVLFNALPAPPELVVAAPREGEPADVAAARARVERLERELMVTKEYLQTTVEEAETTREGLKAANEELQSSNEELEATNEELQTAQEEMQSTNEELMTVNDELQIRMTELSQANDDLHNVLSGVDNAVVIVGTDLKIRRYTAAAEKLFDLKPGDVGRPVGVLDPFLLNGGLESKVSSVVETLSSVEEEVVARNHRWYALRVSPYKSLDRAIRGALVTLVDIDVRKRALETTRDVGAYAARFLAPIGHPLLIVDRALRIVWANDVFLSTFQLTADETVGSVLASVGARQLGDPRLKERVEDVFATGSVFRDHEMSLRFPSLGERKVRVGGSQVPASPETLLALLSIEPLGDMLAAT